METTNQDLQEAQQPGPEDPYFTQKHRFVSPRDNKEREGVEERESEQPLVPAETPKATDIRIPVVATSLKKEAHEAPQQEEEQPPPEKRQKLLPEEEPTPPTAPAARAEAQPAPSPSPSPILDQPTAIIESIKSVPAGETRTYSEVAFIAGFPRAATTVGKIIRGLNLTEETFIPWHRVVSQDGKLRAKSEGEEQLRRLIEEGARPREEESIEGWLERVGKKVVGVYGVGPQKMVFTDNMEELGEKVSKKKVEGFSSVEQAEERGWVRMAT